MPPTPNSSVIPTNKSNSIVREGNPGFPYEGSEKLLDDIYGWLTDPTITENIKGLEMLFLIPNLEIDELSRARIYEGFLNDLMTKTPRGNVLIIDQHKSQTYAELEIQIDFLILSTYPSRFERSNNSQGYEVVDYTAQSIYEETLKYMLPGLLVELSMEDGVYYNDELQREMMEDTVKLTKFMYLINFYNQNHTDEYLQLLSESPNLQELVREAEWRIEILRGLESEYDRPICNLKLTKDLENETLQYEIEFEDSLQITYAYLLDLLNKRKRSNELDLRYFSIMGMNLPRIFQIISTDETLNEEERQYLVIHILSTSIEEPLNTYNYRNS